MPKWEMGGEAVSILVKKINREEGRARLRMPVKLVVRHST
jgi:DNA-binding LacI/PurR family transcriptional regulator